MRAPARGRRAGRWAGPRNAGLGRGTLGWAESGYTLVVRGL